MGYTAALFFSSGISRTKSLLIGHLSTGYLVCTGPSCQSDPWITSWASAHPLVPKSATLDSPGQWYRGLTLMFFLFQDSILSCTSATLLHAIFPTISPHYFTC